MAIYADGVIVCSGTGIFFSVDGEETWMQINKASVHSSGDDYGTFNSRSNAARTDQGRCTFAIYEGTSEIQKIVISGRSIIVNSLMPGMSCKIFRMYLLEMHLTLALMNIMIQATGFRAEKKMALHTQFQTTSEHQIVTLLTLYGDLLIWPIRIRYISGNPTASL